MAKKKAQTEEAAPAQTEAVPEAAAPVEAAPVPKAPKVDSERQAAWDAFLEKAEAQAEKNGTLHVFNEQKARGEFDSIPNTFGSNHFIR